MTIDEMQYAKQLIEKKSKQHKMRGVVQTIKKPQILHKGFTPLVPKKESRPKKDTEKSVQVVLIVVLLIVLVLIRVHALVLVRLRVVVLLVVLGLLCVLVWIAE